MILGYINKNLLNLAMAMNNEVMSSVFFLGILGLETVFRQTKIYFFLPVLRIYLDCHVVRSILHKLLEGVRWRNLMIMNMNMNTYDFSI